MTTNSASIVIALHDGFYGSGTGAGNSNHAFLHTLTTQITPRVQLVIMPIRLSSASSEYDPTWHQRTLHLLSRVPARVIPLDNGTNGQTRFGGLDCFRTTSQAAATAIAQLPNPGLIVAFDVPFYGLAPLLPHQTRGSLINVARATAALQAPHDSDRIIWEQAGLLATATAGGHIAAISQHIRHHLTSAYALPSSAITDLTNGLTDHEQQPSHPVRTSLLPPAAQTGFLLSLGRAEPYKGFDDLLDALHILTTSHIPLPHTFLAAVTDDLAPTSYQRHLAHRIATERLDVTLHTTYHPGVRGLLAHPALAGVIIPSRAEPFGRIPLEAYAADASPVIATTAGGLAETVINGHTGYTAAPADPASLAAAIRQALAASPADRARMTNAGRHLTATRYHYPSNVRAFLTTHAPWALAHHQST